MSKCLKYKQNKHRKTKLKKLCDTPWVKRHDSIITFKESNVLIVSALDDFQHDENQETSNEATKCLNSIKNSNFLVTLEVSAVCFAYTVKFSVTKQTTGSIKNCKL